MPHGHLCELFYSGVNANSTMFISYKHLLVITYKPKYNGSAALHKLIPRSEGISGEPGLGAAGKKLREGERIACQKI
jgi:hypothetical protein